jgi:hypothetical protein
MPFTCKELSTDARLVAVGEWFKGAIEENLRSTKV